MGGNIIEHGGYNVAVGGHQKNPMQRLFRFTLILGAVALLSLTTALGLTHGDRGPVQTIVIEQDQPSPSQRLALVIPGEDAPHVFTPAMDGVQYHGLSSDGKWMIYIGEGESDALNASVTGGLFRTRGLIYDTHLTADRVSSVHLMTTPENGEWLVYESWNNLYFSRLNGGERQDLRSLMPSGTWPDMHHGITVSPESGSVLFTGEGGGGSAGGGYGGRGHEHAIYRLRVGDGQVENVSEYIGGRISPVAWLDVQNWVVISHNGGLYWKPSTGSELTALFDRPENGLSFVDWFSGAGILLVKGQTVTDGFYAEEYYGFRPGELTPAWTVSSVDGRFFDVTPDENWLIFSRTDGRLERMHPDGSGREILTALPDDLQYGMERNGVSPDGEWVLGWSRSPEGGSRVYRVHLATGTPELLLDVPGAVIETAWSPDGEWVLVSDTAASIEFSVPRVAAVHVETGELAVVSDEQNAARFAGWGPIVGKHWSLGLLVVAGLCLGGVGLMRLPMARLNLSRRAEE